ncbi:FAD-dependent monooxygenase [Nocardia sp. BMG51109]|uniref:FAD-dependent monooxygenase n=1 Tax=Nocardia sp. BMG51109 TaxID=1056816 RepID=UPI000465BE5C|nr:FAD-dependent monooxygenase [Nocardia sp. BMG51109]
MPTRPVRRVLIAGGGIGGLAAALALQRKGFGVTVFECADALRDGGAGLHIWTNGTIVLDRLGVAGPVLEVAPAQQICHFGTWRGEMFGAWPVGDFVTEYGRPTLAVERSVLHSILHDALHGDPVRTGARVVGFDQDSEGVTVRLADGRHERGDILIGADGIHSVVRAGLFGDTPARFNGYIAWRGKGRLEHELIPPGSFYALFGRGTRFTYYDVAPGVVHWMSVANGPAGGHDERGVAAMLAERHRGWMPPVQDILAASPEEDIIRSDVFDRKPDRRWGIGRVTLLGDAVHPITFNIGQGACQALEDALVLAERLDACRDDPGRALRRYERERRGRTASMQRVAWLIGRMGAVEHPLLIAAREVFMRLVWPALAFRIAEHNQIAYARRWSPPPPPMPSTEEENRWPITS